MNQLDSELQLRSVAQRLLRATAMLGCVLGLLCAPHAAMAELKFSPTVGVQYIYYSNVFSLASDGGTIAGVDGERGRADHSIVYSGGFNADYLFSRQKLTVDLHWNDATYKLFTQLNHNEYTADATLTWKMGRLLDGTLGYSQERSMVAFTELDTTQPTRELLLQTTKTGVVSANLQMTPDWRLETGATIQTLDSPRPDNPDLQLDENTDRIGLRYVGIAHLSFGLDTNYVDGKFKGDPTAPTSSYQQHSYQLAADYSVSGLSSFNGGIGYTTRKQQGGLNATMNHDISAVTGKLGYTRKISAKTNITLQLSRAVNSYVTAVSSEIDTMATLNLDWQITGKTTTDFQYGYTNSDFPGELVDPTGSATRLDHAQFVNFSVIYQALRWLAIKPYLRYETRESNMALLQYHANSIGIEVRATGAW